MHRQTDHLRVKRRGGALGWVLVLLLMVIAGSALWLWVSPPVRNSWPPGQTGRADGGPPKEDLILWFASHQQDALASEKRSVSPSPTPNDRAKAALRELIDGPKADTVHVVRTLPVETKVRELFIDDQGTAYVDFTDAVNRNHPGGPWAEMLSILSIVQTLTANVPEIKRVQILIEGREVETLAGHIDIRGPITSTWVMSQR